MDARHGLVQPSTGQAHATFIFRTLLHGLGFSRKMLDLLVIGEEGVGQRPGGSLEAALRLGGSALALVVHQACNAWAGATLLVGLPLAFNCG
ncbi:hypothetical protein D3C71_1199010 [compost metagenome]